MCFQHDMKSSLHSFLSCFLTTIVSNRLRTAKLKKREIDREKWCKPKTDLTSSFGALGQKASWTCGLIHKLSRRSPKTFLTLAFQDLRCFSPDMCRDLREAQISFCLPWVLRTKSATQFPCRYKASCIPLSRLKKKNKQKKPKELTVVTPQEMCVYFIHYDLYVLLPPDLYGIWLELILHSLLTESPEINLLQSAKDIVAQFSWT